MAAPFRSGNYSVAKYLVLQSLQGIKKEFVETFLNVKYAFRLSMDAFNQFRIVILGLIVYLWQLTSEAKGADTLGGIRS